MKTSFAGKALSWMLAATLCFSLTPAWAEEPADANAKQQVSSAQEGAEATSPADLQEDSDGSLEKASEQNEDARGLLRSEGTDASNLEEGGAASEGVVDEDVDSDASEEGSDTAEDDVVSEAPLEEGVYLIRSNVADGVVLDVAGGSLENAANIQIYTSNMSAAQRFRAIVDEEGFYTFVNEASGKALDVTGGSAESGTNVQQYALNGSDAQKWALDQMPDGSYAVRSKLSDGLVLDVEGGLSADGTNVQVYEDNSSSAQRFVFVDVNPDVAPSDKVEGGIYLLQSALDPALAVGMDEQSRDNGVPSCLREESWGTARHYIASMTDDGYVTFRSVNTGKMLDVDAGNLVPGTRVQQWSADEGNKNQEWSLRLREDGACTIVSRSNGLALDVQGASAQSGSRVQTYTLNGTAAQLWRLVPVERALEDGLYSLPSAVDPSKVMDVKDAATADGSRVQLWSRNDTPAQKFLLAWHSYRPASEGEAAEDGVGTVSSEGEAPSGEAEEIQALTIRPMTATGQYLTAWDDGTVTLEQPSAEKGRQLWIPSVASAGGLHFTNVETGNMLDVSGGGSYDGCPIGSYSPNGTAAQVFYADVANPVDAGTYIVQSVSDGRALDVNGGSRSNGENVQVWTRNGSGAQAWVIEPVGDGAYRLTNARSKKALDVVGGSAASGANVQQYEWNGSNAQLWRARANDDGSYTFVSACGDLALDVSGGGGYDGANVQVYDANESAAQKWRLIPTTYVQQDFEDLLGSFTTYSTNTWNGTYNMQRALSSFNGVVLQPGESVSFFGVAGPCGAAEGYLPAGVVGGVGYGGGICQASTTIYGAAIRAGFGIVDRQNHSVPSTYVPIGLDAMVNWGTSDLVVRNDTEYPAMFVTHTYDNVLTCEIWGIQPDWYDYIEPISWYTSSSSADAQRIYYKDGVAIYTEWLPSSYYW